MMVKKTKRSPAKGKLIKKESPSGLPSSPRVEVPEGKQPSPKKQFLIVAIGASAGGLEAYEEFFKAMPNDSGIAFILVSHLAPEHISLLPELLQKCTSMKVREITEGTIVEPNTAYVIPPNKDLSILNGVLHLLDFTKPRGINLPIDTFFRSLALDQGAHAVAIVLSGTGSDGTLGLKAVKEKLGMVMAQDEASAKYDGMPRSAVSTGMVDYVLPPAKMPNQLVRYTKRALPVGEYQDTSLVESPPNALQKIFVLLRNQTEQDFSQYKKNTICRRVERRMNVHEISNIEDYVRYLQESDREVSILFKDLLIGVTSFFRDSDAFDALKREALIPLLKSKPDDATVRIWVPACSSGEEAYSIAILMHECMEELNQHFNVQIFGTDIDEDAINTARAGQYPDSIVSDVGHDRLKRYFAKEEDGRYRIKKIVREMLVFAPQNIIKDPPFTKLDLLSCRNLLIYLGQELQRKLLPIFHYSLSPGGILFLGTSETIGQSDDLYGKLDNKWKIFKRKPIDPTSIKMLLFNAQPAMPQQGERVMPEMVRKVEELSALQLVETILRNSDMPPCAVVDAECKVIYIHGRTGKFLEPPEGTFDLNLIKMARQGLKAELSASIRTVVQNRKEVKRRNISVQENGGRILMDLTVKPFFEQSAIRGLMMVVFEEVPKASKKGVKEATAPAKVKAESEKTVRELEEELAYTKETLQTTIEELETSNEELKSTNEELQSTNEELQSTNEEMETSKEELQSLNEEAVTVNAELQSRIDELSKANDDIKNLLASTGIATIFLDIDLSVRRFTPKVTEFISLVGTDCGRPLRHFTTKLVDTDLTLTSEEVLRTLNSVETEVTTTDGDTFAMRVRPYRTTNNVIDGVVITFEDISSSKDIWAKLKVSEERWCTIFEKAAVPTVLINPVDGGILEFNDLAHESLQYSREEFAGLKMGDFETHEVGNYAEMASRKLSTTFPARHMTKDGDTRKVSVSARTVEIRGQEMIIASWH